MHISVNIQQRVMEQVNRAAMISVGEVARQTGIPEQLAVECLPANTITRIATGHFEEVMVMVATWGTVTVSVETGAFTSMVTGMLPLGAMVDQKYVFESSELYSLGGTVNLDALQAIYFLEGKIGGTEHKSIMFYDHGGSLIFSISLPKDKDGNYQDEQVEFYNTLRSRISGLASCSCCSS